MEPTPEQKQTQQMYMHIGAIARLLGIDPRRLGKEVMDMRAHEHFMAGMTEGHIEWLEREGRKADADIERKILGEMKKLSPFFDDK